MFDRPYDDVYEALRDAVRAIGGAKTVAGRLRPDRCRSPEGLKATERWLLDTINPDRDVKLDPTQFLAIVSWAREAGFHGLKHFVDDDTKYKRTEPVVAEEELARAIAALAAQQRRLEERQQDVATVIDNPRLLASLKAAGVNVEALLA